MEDINIIEYPWNKDNIIKLKQYEKELLLYEPNLTDWQIRYKLKLEWRRLEYIEQEKVEKERELVFFKVTLPLYKFKVDELNKQINFLNSSYKKIQYYYNREVGYHQWEQDFCGDLLELKLKHRNLQNDLRKKCIHKFTPFNDFEDYIHKSSCIYCQLSGKELYNNEFKHY